MEGEDESILGVVLDDINPLRYRSGLGLGIGLGIGLGLRLGLTISV
jgi:hypothetical protein